MKVNKNYAKPAIIKAVEVLDFVAQKGSATYSDFHKELNMPKSSSFFMVNTLLQCGLLRESPDGGYRLGIKLFSLGNRALLDLDIRDEAKPLMQGLVREVGETSFLAVMNGGEAVYIAKSENNKNLVFLRTSVGMRLSLQSTAIGKTLLAWRDEETVRKILAEHKPTRYTDKAIIDTDPFLRHLEVVRRHGFAMTNRETHNDCVCIAAPVFSTDKAPIGGLSVVMLVGRLAPEFLALVSQRVHSAAKLLSERLGTREYPEFIPMPYPEDGQIANA